MSTIAGPGHASVDQLALPVDSDDHLAGSPNAPVVLVEYGDFECP